MAIEIPPLVGFTNKVFRLVYKQQLTPVQSGYIQTLDRVDPFWIAQYQTNALRDDQYDAAITFLDALEGSRNTFLAYDPRRPMPRAYQNQSLAANPWLQGGQASVVVTAADYNASTLTLGHLLTGAIISAGDYISFQVGDIWYLFRNQVTQVVIGNTATITVKPRPLDMSAVSYTARYRKACAEMKMIGGCQETDSVDGRPVLSWQATQFINRGS